MANLPENSNANQYSANKGLPDNNYVQDIHNSDMSKTGLFEHDYSDRDAFVEGTKATNDVDSNERLSAGYDLVAPTQDLINQYGVWNNDTAIAYRGNDLGLSRVYYYGNAKALFEEFVQTSDITTQVETITQFGHTHTPFELEAIDFYSNVIGFIGVDIPNDVIYDAIKFGQVTYYQNGDFVKTKLDAIPVYDVEDNFIGVIYESQRDEETFGWTMHLNNGEVFTYYDEQLDYQQTFAMNVWHIVKSTRDGRPFYAEVLDLIDAYDSSQDNTRMYMNDLATAQLILSGGNETIAKRMLSQLGKASIINLPNQVGGDGDLHTPKAEYIHKSYDVSGDEAFKSRLSADIRRILGLPDFDNLGGNTSADALKIKLTTTTQKASGIANNIIGNIKGATYNIYYGFETDEATPIDNQALGNIIDALR
jgi:hypothetical protein